jgi:hypothetical protein
MAFPPASVNASPLDGPPPSPTPMGDMAPGGPMSVRGLVPGQAPVTPNMLPPEILRGVMQTGETIDNAIKSIMQLAPDKGAQLSLIQSLLQQVFAEIVAQAQGNPGQTISPTAAGPAPPMGGIDRGISGAGTI